MVKFRILCATWNVNSKSPQDQDLSKWLCKSSHPPDIVAVSCQEIVALTDMTKYVQTWSSEEACESWGKMFVSCLEGHKPYNGIKYRIVAAAPLVGVMTCVLARTSHIERISDVMLGFSSVGTFGVLGNKGAVAIRLELAVQDGKPKSLCFVGSHFSAHQREVAKRNADYEHIMGGLQFHPLDEKAFYFNQKKAMNDESNQIPGSKNSDATKGYVPVRMGLLRTHYPSPGERNISPQGESPRKKVSDITIGGHDIIFWCGDLNYRIESLDWKEAIAFIKHKSLHRLLENDQLISERTQGRVFKNFHEGVITFDPTYKFKPGTNNYDTKVEVTEKRKIRVPAWCDRVLWCTNDNTVTNQVHLCSYYSSDAYMISDHKPVGAEFVLPFVEFDKSKPTMLKNRRRSLSSSTAPPSLKASHRKLPVQEKVSVQVQAICYHEADSSLELSFELGDLINLRSSKKNMPPGWLYGVRALNNAEGYFPESKIEYKSQRTPVKKATARKKVAKPKSPRVDLGPTLGQHLDSILQETSHELQKSKQWMKKNFGTNAYATVVAMNNFQASEFDELSFEQGQEIEILSSALCDGWVVARIESKQGLVPRSHLKEKQ